MKPGVTVVIPTINRASLGDVLNSVIGQSHQPYDVIIVDDSKDQSVKSSVFRVIRTGGLMGVSKARNLGMHQVTTEFIALLDDDDKWHKEYLEKQLMHIESLGIDFSITAANVNGHDRPKTPLRVGVDPFELLYGKPHILRSNAYLPTSAYLFRTKMIERLTFDESITDRENLNFVWNSFKMNYKIHQDSEPLVTINYSTKDSLSRINVTQEINWYRFLKNLNKDWGENFLIESARNFIRNGDLASARFMFSYLDPERKSLSKALLKLVVR